MSDEQNLDPPPESPSEDGEPLEGMVSESPSDETPATDDSDELSDLEDGGDSTEETDDEGKPTDAEGRREWDQLEKKYQHIKDPDARKEAIARAYWEKARYARSTRETLEAKVAKLEAELELARTKPEKAKEPEEPAKPHPDVEKVEQRIQTLYQRDQKIQQETAEQLQRLAALDREIAIAEDRLKDAYDEQKPTFEARLAQSKREYDFVRRILNDNDARREDLYESMRQALADRDWILKFQQDQAKRESEAQEQKQRETADFTRELDALTIEQADKLGIPKDPSVRQMMTTVVNADLVAFFRQHPAPSVDDVDWQNQLTRSIRQFASGLDLVKRKTFAKKSDEKLAVVGRPGPGKESQTAARVPAYKRAPVPASLLARETDPAMARAREILVKKFG